MKKLVSIVTVCALMVSIGTFSVFAATDAGTAPIKAYSSRAYNTTLDNNVTQYVSAYNMEVELQTIDIDLNEQSSNPKYYTNLAVSQQYKVIYKFANWGGYPKAILSTTPFLDINTNRNTFDNTQLSFVGYHIDSTDNCDVEITSSGRIYFYPRDNSMLSNGIFLPPMSTLTMSVTFTKTYNVTIEGYADAPVIGIYNQQITSIVYPAPSTSILELNVNTSNIDYNLYRVYQNTNDMKSYLNSLNSNVQSILDAYTSQSQNAQAVTNGTNTNEQTLSNIGQNEDTWFSQNDQALTATGMNDFTYTPQVMSGLTVISDQFNQLWLAIGDWNFVYTFSMMIGLVVLILRHNPQRKKNSGGKSNATGS